jgi:riboflavin kinase/FMN adenylyltransferase
VVTFADHPARLLAPERAPALLSTPSERIALLAGCGVDFVLVLPLTEQLLRTDADEFVEDLLVRDLAVRTAVVGTNFRFGHRASGDPATLSRLGRPHGMHAVAVGLVDDDGSPISSTRIRGEIAAGRVRAAASLLGRPHSLTVTVTSTRPRRLVATAGLRAAVPGAGVYRGVLTAADGRSTRPFLSVDTAGTVSIATDPPVPVGEHVRVDLLGETTGPIAITGS